MASTKRKSKKENKEPAIQEQAAADNSGKLLGDYLSPEHLMALETGSRDIENSRLRMGLEEQSLHNMSLQLELLKSKIEKQKLVVGEKARQYTLTEQKYNSLKQDIFKIYSLSGEKFGYDTISGKISLD